MVPDGILHLHSLPHTAQEDIAVFKTSAAHEAASCTLHCMCRWWMAFERGRSKRRCNGIMLFQGTGEVVK